MGLLDPPVVRSVVNHGADADATRPPVNGPVLWEGSVEPDNMIDGDLWIDTDAEAILQAPPQLVIPPASILSVPGNAAWFAQYGATFQRFQLAQAMTARYLLCQIGAASGNIQVGVVGLSGASDFTYTRIAHSGIIAAPGNGARRIDLGAFELDPTAYREFALFFWADNTTITMPHGISAGAAAMRFTSSPTLTNTGVPASGALVDWASTRYLASLALEGNI